MVFVTGDAYVDHPSFAMALLGRVLEAEGFRVAILSQPDWHSCDAWRTFGRPRLCFAVSAGNMDSMLNHYTAARKVRNDDAYSPGGQPGRRPDRATLAYCQRAREAYRGVPIIAGGVEASLRRLAHYDFWSDKVRRSILLDAKADLLVFGMGERPLVEIVKRLAAGEPIRQLRDIRGVAYRLGASEAKDEGGRMKDECDEAQMTPTNASSFILHPSSFIIPSLLPSYEAVSTDKAAFAAMTRIVHEETNPDTARRLVQYHGREAVVVNPPAWPLDAGGDRPHLRPAVHAPAAPQLRPRADSGLRGGQGLDPDHAGLFRRLRVLLDHRCTRAASSRAAARRRSWRKSAAWPRSPASRARSATSAARPPTCTRWAARSRKCARSAGG